MATWADYEWSTIDFESNRLLTLHLFRLEFLQRVEAVLEAQYLSAAGTTMSIHIPDDQEQH